MWLDTRDTRGQNDRSFECCSTLIADLGSLVVGVARRATTAGSDTVRRQIFGAFSSRIKGVTIRESNFGAGKDVAYGVGAEGEAGGVPVAGGVWGATKIGIRRRFE